jgi:hypothetical protein
MYTHDAMLYENKKIVEEAEHIRLDLKQLQRVADILVDGKEITKPSSRRDVPDLPPDDLLQYYMIVGCHNFLFWQGEDTGNIEAIQMQVDGKVITGARTSYVCHSRAIQEGKAIIDPEYLINMTLDEMKDYYRDEATGSPVHKLIPQRLAKFCEIGAVLKDKYNGSFLSLLERSEGYLFRDDGNGIAQQLVKNFQFSYGDWPFCKLIMVAIGNLYMNRNELFPPGSKPFNLINLRDPENLEVGADYYRPFFLYRVGLLEVSSSFKEHITEKKFIPRDSSMEREFRAWTILTAHELVQRIGGMPVDLADELWGMGFLRCRLCYNGVDEDEVPCQYRKICHSYNEDTSMMNATWPLVITTTY